MGVLSLSDRDPHQPLMTIGPGGFAPIALLAALFGLYGARTGIPVTLAACLGAVGGTASLLVHELGHVQAARGLAGIRTVSVSLIWFGAATRLEGKYGSGRDQAKVAIAGPRWSFNMAVAFFVMSFLPMPEEYRHAVVLLALFNVAIGLLNLIPVYPLDGHKLVVGLVWSATGSEKRARRILRRIGLAWAALEMPAMLVACSSRGRGSGCCSPWSPRASTPRSSSRAGRRSAWRCKTAAESRISTFSSAARLRLARPVGRTCCVCKLRQFHRPDGRKRDLGSVLKARHPIGVPAM